MQPTHTQERDRLARHYLFFLRDPAIIPLTQLHVPIKLARDWHESRPKRTKREQQTRSAQRWPSKDPPTALYTLNGDLLSYRLKTVARRKLLKDS